MNIRFKSHAEAAVALAKACAANNNDQLLAILGVSGRELISSGDEVADKPAPIMVTTFESSRHKGKTRLAARRVILLAKGATL